MRELLSTECINVLKTKRHQAVIIAAIYKWLSRVKNTDRNRLFLLAKNSAANTNSKAHNAMSVNANHTTNKTSPKGTVGYHECNTTSHIPEIIPPHTFKNLRRTYILKYPFVIVFSVFLMAFVHNKTKNGISYEKAIPSSSSSILTKTIFLPVCS